MSSYKPSVLLITTPTGSSIDDKLGVSKLVNSSTTSSPKLPQASNASRARRNVDNWSANNGSVIYAQPNSAKSYSRFDTASKQVDRSSNDQETTCNHNHSNMSAPSHINGHISQQEHSTSSNGLLPVLDGANNTRSDNSRRQQGSTNNTMQILEDTCEKSSGGEDLTDIRSNWSNRTSITSDLLF